jgi:hypothetical protein
MKKIFSWIRILYCKISHLLKILRIKIHVHNLESQLQMQYMLLGKESYDRDPETAARHQIPLSQLKKDSGTIIQEMEHAKELVTWKMHDFELARKEHTGSISQGEEKVKQLKIRLKEIKARLKENKKSLDVKMAIEKNSAKKFIVLTIYRNKEDYNKTLLDLQRFAEEEGLAKKNLEVELQNAREKLSQGKVKWGRLQERFSIEIRDAHKQQNTILRKNSQLEHKLNALYRELGCLVDQLNEYPGSLQSYRDRIQKIKDTIAGENALLKEK